MRNRIVGACCYLASCSAILILLITSIDINAFSRNFYESEYASMDTATSLDMSHQDLMNATTTLLDYLQDKRDDVVTEITVREMPRPAFNERESLHMVDVKDLYQWALQVRMLCGVLLVLGIAYVIWIKRKESWTYITTAFAQVSIIFICIVTMLGLWAMVDFTSLWESFHKLFFNNDLWLLNPRTDLMINMFPEDFFFHMVLRIVGVFLLAFGILFGGSVWYMNKKTHFLSSWRKVR